MINLWGIQYFSVLRQHPMYLFVEGSVYAFHTAHPIVHLSSPVGNSDSPYPWGLDIEGNVYFFQLGSVVRLQPTKSLARLLSDPEKDPYDYFFEARRFLHRQNGIWIPVDGIPSSRL